MNKIVEGWLGKEGGRVMSKDMSEYYRPKFSHSFKIVMRLLEMKKKLFARVIYDYYLLFLR